jgi:hypothetical protein
MDPLDATFIKIIETMIEHVKSAPSKNDKKRAEAILWYKTLLSLGNQVLELDTGRDVSKDSSLDRLYIGYRLLWISMKMRLHKYEYNSVK